MYKRSFGKYTVFSFLLFMLFTGTGLSQKEISIHYFKPYSYSAGNNSVKAWLDPKETGESFSLFLNGKNINYQIGDSGRIELQLPLAGKEVELVIYYDSLSGHKILARQMFRPLVPSDWGYFGKGTVNIICSSHQDIAWMNTPDSCREQRIHDIIIPALDLIDKDPAFRFEMEQTLNLMEVLDAVPAERQRIINAYKNGQFTWGATFNQPDRKSVV